MCLRLFERGRFVEVARAMVCEQARAGVVVNLCMFPANPQEAKVNVVNPLEEVCFLFTSMVVKKPVSA